MLRMAERSRVPSPFAFVRDHEPPRLRGYDEPGYVAGRCLVDVADLPDWGDDERWDRCGWRVGACRRACG